MYSAPCVCMLHFLYDLTVYGVDDKTNLRHQYSSRTGGQEDSTEPYGSIQVSFNSIPLQENEYRISILSKNCNRYWSVFHC